MLLPKILILAGDGLNTEREMQQAVFRARGLGVIVHINDLLTKREQLANFQGLIIPGGFSFGDHLGSGHVLALKIKYQLMDQLIKFVEQKKPILGVCNGFQVLVKIGLLPWPFEKSSISLAHNSQGQFVNKWVELKVEKDSSCIWTKSLSGTISLPIRHGQGAVTLKDKGESQTISPKQIPLKYLQNVNGSYQKMAAICNPTGTILGMMPHPEAYLSNLFHPSTPSISKETCLGLEFFKNGINYIKET